MKFNRLVTALDADGKSVFVDKGQIRSAVAGGMNIQNVWGTEDGIADVGPGVAAEPTLFPFFPGPGGHRVVVVEFPPESAVSGDSGDDDPERTQPGLIGVFEADDPGFHRTDSIDYGICMDGEMTLVLDDGQERPITPGTIVVQRGTRHAWKNRGDKVCTMIYVLLGANRK